MANKVTMNICGQEYTLVADESAAYMEQVGTLVNQRMRQTQETLRVSRADAAVLRTRSSELRAAARAAQDREEAERLKRRIAELQVLRRQSSELAELTKRYYERNYHRDERYTL